MKRTAILAVFGILALCFAAAQATNPPGAPDDHFLAYKTKPSLGGPKFQRIPGVRLVDHFEDVTVDVLSPADLFVPADKNGEGIIDPATHLRGYKIKPVKGTPKHTKRQVTVTDQLGSVRLETVKPELLLVPSAKDLLAIPPAPNPASHDVDHFKCYLAKVPKGAPAFPKGQQVRVTDQFTPAPVSFELVKPRHLCVPVNKRGEGIKNPAGGLTCYQVKRFKGQCAAGAPTNALRGCKTEEDCGGSRGATSLCLAQGTHAKRLNVGVNNQFGPLLLDTVKESEFCIPSVGAGPTATPAVTSTPTASPSATPTPVVNPTTTPTGTPAGLCGNGVVDAPEQCDGASAAACPGRCLANCRCGIEQDTFPDARFILEVQLGASTEELTLTGPVTLATDLGGLGDADGDTKEDVPVELVSLSMSGTSALVGPVNVTLRSPGSDPFLRSLGSFEETTNTTVGILDVPPFTASGTLDTRIELYTQSFLPTFGTTQHNHAPYVMQGSLRHLPPTTGGVFRQQGSVDLVDEAGAPVGATVLSSTLLLFPPSCGNDVLEPGETCDGADAPTCPGACQADCTCGTVPTPTVSPTSSPTPTVTPFSTPTGVPSPAPVCGDNLINQPSEQCDGTIDGLCPGACRPDCTCGPVCGDGTANQVSEACDRDDLRGQTCAGAGYATGVPTCQRDCSAVDYSTCLLSLCGDSRLTAEEPCDGALLRGETCTSLGFSGGTLSCLSSCLGFDTSQCTTPTALPPEPASVAPPLDQTVPTTDLEEVSFLYEGTPRVQFGVAAGVIHEDRAAAVYGTITDRDGNPLSGVKVSIQDRPEYGLTLSRLSGQYDLAVNGGEQLGLNYTKAGYLPVQRRLDVSQSGFTQAETVVLIQQDPVVTTIDLSSSLPIQTAMGSVVTDADGTRQAAVMIPQGTQAQLVQPDGSLQPVSTLHVRLTEYTVGPNGEQAMPGPLPPTNQYTYAIELGTDEAVAKVAGRDVVFSQPVSLYVTNFLGIPTGEFVPLGYYDKDRKEWVPLPDGRVIQIVGITAGRADVDISGDGVAESAAELAALSITTAERDELARLYAVGTSLWRLRTTHFSTHDPNYGIGCGAGNSCGGPSGPGGTGGDGGNNQGGLTGDNSGDCGHQATSSIIECENQNLRESLPIVGSPLTLNYASDRTSGRTVDVRVPLTSSTPEATLREVVVTFAVAGITTTRRFNAAPNLQTVFSWNGLDRYGRLVQGGAKASVSVHFDYAGFLNRPPSRALGSFGLPPSGPMPGTVPSRAAFRMSQTYPVELHKFDIRGTGLGGWSLSPHHVFDPKTKVLYRGDGTRRTASSIGPIITTVAGNGTRGRGGDGGLAIDAQLGNFLEIEATAGGVAVEDNDQHVLRGFTLGGSIATLADRSAYAPLPFLRVSYRDNCAAYADSSSFGVYYAGLGLAPCRLPSWGITVGSPGAFLVAGTFFQRGFSGDDGPALNAKLGSPLDVAIHPSAGGFAIADGQNGHIRYVTPAGTIQDLIQLPVTGDTRIAYASNGDLYIRTGTRIWVLRVGRVTLDHVAGTFTAGNSGDDGPAVAAQFGFAGDIAVGLDGTVYVSDTFNNRVRAFQPGGFMFTVAGTGTPGLSGDGGPAADAQLKGPQSLAVGADGSLYIGDNGNFRIRRVVPFQGDLNASRRQIADDHDGRQVYEFIAGRHVRTRHALTGGVLWEFSYDGAGRLAQVRDGDGNTHTVEHDGAGQPAAIVAPYGQRTTLSVDANGYLATVTNPANETHSFISTAQGLLTQFTNPRGYSTNYSFDTSGRLGSVQDAAGGTQTFVRADFNTAYSSGYEVTRTTGLGRVWKYRYQQAKPNPLARMSYVRRFTRTDPDGLVTTTELGGPTNTTASPDGSITTERIVPGAQFGMQLPVRTDVTTRLPSGLVTDQTSTENATFANPRDPGSLLSLVKTQALNGRATTTTFDAVTRTQQTITPEGRVFTARLDVRGRPTSSQSSALAAVESGYDSRGRLASIAQGTGPERRTSTVTYDANGYAQVLQDPLIRTTTLEYDDAGRVKRQLVPGVGGPREVLFGYDPSGNLASLTPPGRPAHTFNYTPVDLESVYTPPDVGLPNEATTTAYNGDRQTRVVMRPDGQTITYNHDLAGRLDSVVAPHGTTTYTYDAAGRVSSITAPGPESLTYTYDGSLLRKTEWTGTVNGSVERTYDADRRLKTISVNGADPVSYDYNADGLVVRAGLMTIERDPLNGLAMGTTLGNLRDSWTYNAFGEPWHYTAIFNATVLYDLDLARDDLGRITDKIETIEGDTDTYHYDYDEAGRLWKVITNGSLTAIYTYDENNNRLSAPGLSGAPIYDDQDRLLVYDGDTFTYTANGERLTKTMTDGMTTYDNDAFGALRRVELSGGGKVAYVIDPLGRRTGRRVNGSMAQGFLYQSELEPVAELDDTGAVGGRFIFVPGSNVPAYMVKDGVTYRIVTDYLGSPRLVLDAQTGLVVQRMRHDEFGRVTAETGQGFQPFGFGGGIADPSTALIRFGARDYDANTGRWTSKDPVGFLGSRWNSYAYVVNDPINVVDPLGLTDQFVYCGRHGHGFEGLGLFGYDSNEGIYWGGIGAVGLDGGVLSLYGGYEYTSINGLTPIVLPGMSVPFPIKTSPISSVDGGFYFPKGELPGLYFGVTFRDTVSVGAGEDAPTALSQIWKWTPILMGPIMSNVP